MVSDILKKLHRIQDKAGRIKFELYNLIQDPMETDDVADQQPDQTESMKSALHQWLTSVVQSLNGEDYT